MTPQGACPSFDYTDDRATAARLLKSERADLGVLLLSQHIETANPADLVAWPGFGYLLKDRVFQVNDFVKAAERVAGGGSALDPQGAVSMGHYDQFFPAFLAAFGSEAFAHDTVWRSDDFSAVALWLSPGIEPDADEICSGADDNGGRGPLRRQHCGTRADGRCSSALFTPVSAMVRG